jgi:adenine-specific DNA-methyltransferase
MPTLNWLPRATDEQTAGRVPYRLLEPVAELSSGDSAAENMLIHGDNLAALKALLPFCAGRGLLLIVEKRDRLGRGVFEQLQAKISGRTNP